MAVSWRRTRAEVTEEDSRAAVSVRDAGPGDAAAVTGMARALSREEGGFPARFTPEAFLRDGFGPDPAFRAKVAEIDGACVGYAVYYPGYDTDSATRGVYLADLFVAADARRRGAGRALVVAVARQCRAEGGRWMFWSVLRGNRGARRFYKALAPELRDVIVCAAFGKGFDRLADGGG